MRYGKTIEGCLKMADFLRKEPGKPFAIATPKGVHFYSCKFVTHEEIAKERQKQDDIKAMFTFDEASDVA